jgi:malate synthase
VVDGTISYISPEGKAYSLKDRVATLIVRPRGLHLTEQHAVVDGERVCASFFDFGLFLFNNFEGLKRKGSAPYYYLPKLEGRKEARLWEKVISESEDYLGIPRGTVKVTALIETLPAAFEMDEILFELRRHVIGLNCGRWDYMFSYIKMLRANPRYLLPNRGQLTMDGGFLAPYVDLLIKTCHRRGAYAIGGMSAYIPVKSDEGANATAFAKVKADKEREFSLGHDGTWVAHPGLVPLAMEVFSKMDGPNQLRIKRDEVSVTRDDLLRVPEGTVTMEGIRGDVRVGLVYLDSWLGGRGCVPIDNLMEDAATTEICRAQLWQWWKHGARLQDGKTVTLDMVRLEISSQVQGLLEARTEQEDKKRVLAAGRIFTEVATSDRFMEFITIPAYDELLSTEADAR